LSVQARRIVPVSVAYPGDTQHHSVLSLRIFARAATKTAWLCERQRSAVGQPELFTQEAEVPWSCQSWREALGAGYPGQAMGVPLSFAISLGDEIIVRAATLALPGLGRRR
jgi:hypothetical protein